MVSAGIDSPTKFERFANHPFKIIESDGRYRGLFKNIGSDKAIELITNIPKLIRYVLLKKND